MSLFGANPVYGAEANREECSKWVEAALPGASVKWHPPEVEKPKKPKPAKATPAKETGESAKVASEEGST